MRYKFTFIVFVLTPLILEEEEIEENPRCLPIVSTHRQLFHFHHFHGFQANQIIDSADSIGLLLYSLMTKPWFSWLRNDGEFLRDYYDVEQLSA